MRNAIRLWAVGRSELCAPCGPDQLAAAHPVWARDVAAFGPWLPDPDLAGFVRAASPASPVSLAFGASGAGTASAAAPAMSGDVVVCGPCASTFAVARQLVAEGVLGPWGAVLSVSQSGGRGQRGRSWHSPPGNVYAALVWPERPGFPPGLTPLLVGLMLAEGLASLGVEAAVKWPNDMLVDNCKVCGILVEERGGLVLAGIGLNVAAPPPATALRDGWAVPAAGLGRAVGERGPLAVWCAALAAGRPVAEALLGLGGGERIVAGIEARLAWRGRTVRIHGGDPAVAEGVLLGLAPDGGARLAVRGREIVLYNGSVTPL
ncbi:MAG: biotin--[acetyl-CoA-carboxylase] ligase [Desulfovibrionaceae bacterium]